MGTINPNARITTRAMQSATGPAAPAKAGAGTGPLGQPTTDSFASNDPLGVSLPFAMVIKAAPLQALAGVENLASGTDSDGNPIFSRQDLTDLSEGKGRFAGASQAQVDAANAILGDQQLETALDQANADGNNFQSENEDDWYNLKALKEHSDSIAAAAVYNENPPAAVPPEAPQASDAAASASTEATASDAAGNDKPEEEPAPASE
ncbi:hypothetical protein [Vampirovibrio chlorellavorus]|uniref:hypothetical protein n=1 Tax=Vampirovibrio chlorellavorus TaxID=758823 RepID=UPI0026EB5A6A|nr:hypothetical protein [Vampirovibrio chlorellavorus]